MRAALKSLVIIGALLAAMLLTACSLIRPGYPDTPNAEKLQKLGKLNLARVSSDPLVTKEEAMEKEPQELLVPLSAPQFNFESEAIDLIALRKILLENNLDIQISRLSKESSHQGVLAALGAFQPSISASVNLSETDSESTSGTVSTRARASTVSGSLGLTVPLLVGGSLEVDYSMSATETSITDLNRGSLGVADSESYASTPNVSLSIPLLRGAGIKITESPVTLAGYEEKASKARFRNQFNSVLIQAEQLYWNLYQAYLTVEIQNEQLELADKQLNIAVGLYKSRAGTKADVLRLQQSYNTQRQSVIEANQTLRVTMRNLLSLLQSPNFKLDTKKILKPSTEPSLAYRKIAAEAVEVLALNNRSDLLEDEYNIASAELQLDIARDQVLPNLTLSLGVAFPGLSNSKYNSAFKNSSDIFSDPTLSAGLVFSTPWGANEAAKANRANAYANYLSSIATREKRIITIRQSVYDAVDELDVSWTLVLHQAHNLQLSKMEYDVEQRLFQVGLVTSNDMSDSLRNLTQSRLSELQAVVRYQLALLGLATSTGILPVHAYVNLSDVPQSVPVLEKN